VPLVGTLILEIVRVQVSVWLHQLPVCHITAAVSRPLGCTGPIVYNVIPDWVTFSKNTQTAHNPGSSGPHPGFPGFRKSQRCL